MWRHAGHPGAPPRRARTMGIGACRPVGQEAARPPFPTIQGRNADACLDLMSMCYIRNETTSFEMRSDMQQTTLATSRAGPDRPGDHPCRVRRVGDRGRRLGVRLGRAGRRRVRRRDRAGAGARGQLDRHRGGLRPRALGGRSCAARSRASTSARTCSPRRACSTAAAAAWCNSLKRDSIRREVEASLTRLGVDAIDLYQIHWPEPGSRRRRGLGGVRRAQGRRAGAPHRRLELRRRPAATRPGDRAGRDAAAAVLARRARRSRRRSCRSPSARASA